MPSVWKSPSACRARLAALPFIAVSFLLVAPASAAPGRDPLALTRAGLDPFSLAFLGDSGTAATPAPPVSPAETLPPAATPAVPPAAAHADQAPAATGKPGHAKKALLLSLLLPGAGELYSGHRGRATGFFISEGAIWANFAAWEIAGHLRKNNYIDQAALLAGIGTRSESDDYWRLVGSFLRSSGSGPDSYEESLRKDARNEFPTDPAAQDAYVAARLPTGDRAWNWSSASAQENFLTTRQNATLAFHRAKFSFALAVLNRLASAIDTQILHRSDTKDDRSSSSDTDEPRLMATVTADGGGMLLIRHRF
jgi:hypothetical protein